MAKTRVSALAKNLGIDSKELIRVLREMGEYVKTASSTLEAPVVHKVYEHFGRSAPSNQPASPPIRRRTPQNNPWRKPAARLRDGVDYYNDGRRLPADSRPRRPLRRPGNSPYAPPQRRPVGGEGSLDSASQPKFAHRPNNSGHGDELDWAAEVFGKRRSDLRRAAPAKPRFGEQGRERLSPDDLKWVEVFLDPSAKQVWTEAGLRPRDAELAKRCVDAGLAPHHLSSLVGSNPIWWWITEGGQSPAWVATQLRLRRAGGESKSG